MQLNKLRFLHLSNLGGVMPVDKDIVDRMFRLVDTKFKEQKDFAAAIGVDASHISRWRNRKSSSYVKRLEKISRVLGVTPQYLLSGGTSEEDAASKESRADEVSEDDLKAAFWGGDKDLSPEDLDAMWGDVKRFAAFIAQQKRQEKQQHD